MEFLRQRIVRVALPGRVYNVEIKCIFMETGNMYCSIRTCELVCERKFFGKIGNGDYDNWTVRSEMLQFFSLPLYIADGVVVDSRKALILYEVVKSLMSWNFTRHFHQMILQHGFFPGPGPQSAAPALECMIDMRRGSYWSLSRKGRDK